MGPDLRQIQRWILPRRSFINLRNRIHDAVSVHVPLIALNKFTYPSIQFFFS